MPDKKGAVLACVTGQYECDRIIKAARRIADEQETEMRVISVVTSFKSYTAIADRIEYLHHVSKKAGSDMTVVFAPDAPRTVSEFVHKNNITQIITGMHDGGSDSFLVRFNRLSPDTAITMVSEDKKIYSMELCRKKA